MNPGRTFRAIHASEHYIWPGDPLLQPAHVNLSLSARSAHVEKRQGTNWSNTRDTAFVAYLSFNLKMVKGASAKRSPLPWRAGGKKQPVSPGAAYSAASTNSESPYCHAESSSHRTPWKSLGCCYRLSGRLRLLTGTPMIWWKYQCFHLIIMGVALDVHVSQARWQ